MPALTRGALTAHRLRRWARTGDNLRSAVQGLGLITAVTLVGAVLLLREDTTAGVRAGRTVTAATTVTVTATSPTPVPAQADPNAVAPRPVPPEQLATLPVALVGMAPGQAIADPAPGDQPGTVVLHPTRDTAVYAAPGGSPVAVLPPYQLLSPTWVPVVTRQPGWALVLLPTRPHPGGTAAAGWIHLHPEIQLAESDRRVEIDTAIGEVVVLAELGRTGSVPPVTQSPAAAGTGAPGRRSFVAIGTTAIHAHWLMRLIRPLTADPARLCTGPLGGLAVPGLPTNSGLGPTDEAGCVRTPQAVRESMGEVPAGTVVLLR
ncbi:hypothetical protein [Saccharothrix xinjiangensis]|uniref:Uncharacterized protein n=1 Tax=Saccharothrix xinjiangensis TaxID=204798 RepID=A0ABV9XVW0_9PSEU